MPFDFDAYVDDLFKDAGDDAAALATQLKERAKANPAIVKQAERGYMRESDASRKMNEADAARKKYTTAYDEVVNWKATKEQEIANWMATHGDPANATPTGDPSVMRSEFGDYVPASKVQEMIDAALSKVNTQINERLEERSELLYGVTKSLMTYQQDYFDRFSERLPTDDLEKFAMDNKVPINVAYPMFIQPKLDKKKDDDFKRQLQEAEERGRRDAMSRLDNPTHVDGGTGALGSTPLTQPRPTDAATAAASAEDAFVKEWNATDGFSNPAGLAARR